jgi:glycolate oxidase subunit GlcD
MTAIRQGGPSGRAAARELARLLEGGRVLEPGAPGFPRDGADVSGLRGRWDAVALPESTEEVARVMAWCYAHDVPIVPRGGGTGFAGGAVPLEGGVVLGLARMDAVRQFDPLLWRMHVEAGVRTATVRRLARENGLLFPPDPGAAEDSQIGGNIATNAGGPHAFKYGVTRSWVTGVEAVVPPGERVEVGGAIRKDVAGYDLLGLLVGSEGTLGVVTAAWLRLLPAPAATFPVAAFYSGADDGCRAVETVLGSGLQAAALEYLDAGALAASAASFPGGVPAQACFAVIAEADGSRPEAERLRDELAEALRPGSLATTVFDARAEIDAFWRWRDGVSIAVTAERGAKLSEDIVVPLDRLEQAIAETIAIGARHGLAACSWGHAGDGNLHSTFLLDPGATGERARAEQAAQELFDLAVRVGGSISGEHGIGWSKRGRLADQWSKAAVDLHERVKRSFDPKGLLNPGKKQAR